MVGASGMLLIPVEYSPEKAKRVKRIGPFNHYVFEDGTRVTVHRRSESDVFGNVPHYDRRGRAKFIKTQRDRVRIAKHGPLDYIAPDFLKNYAKVLASGARFEIPVAWIELAGERVLRGNPFVGTLITKEFSGYHSLSQVSVKPIEFKQRVFEKLAHELGKIHGAGVAHGHPHSENLLVNQHGSVHIIDSKLLRSVNETGSAFVNACSKDDYLPAASTKAGAKMDLSLLEGAFDFVGGEEVNWEKIISAYKKGVETGRVNLRKQTARGRLTLFKAVKKALTEK